MRQPICRRQHPYSRAGFCVCRCWPGPFGATSSAGARCAGLTRLFSKDSSRDRLDEARTPRVTELHIGVAETIDAIDSAEWDACANPLAGGVGAAERDACTGRPAPDTGAAVEEIYNPFISHAFLAALEQSKSVGARTGWQPRHVLARTTDGTLVAAARCHSRRRLAGVYWSATPQIPKISPARLRRVSSKFARFAAHPACM